MADDRVKKEEDISGSAEDRQPTLDELTVYFERVYSKRDLATTLARSVLFRSAVVAPSLNRILRVTTRSKGRPRAEEWQETLEVLREELRSRYPHHTLVGDLAASVGTTPKTICNLAERAAFLYTLPAHLRVYLGGIVRNKRAYFPPLWRAIMDLHHYRLVMETGCAVPFYRMHLVMWAVQSDKSLRMDADEMCRRDATERRRLHRPRFVELLQEFDMPLVPRGLTLYSGWYDLCRECAVSKQWLNASGQEVYINRARKLVGEIGWPTSVPDHVAVQSVTTTGITRELLGGIIDPKSTS